MIERLCVRFKMVFFQNIFFVSKIQTRASFSGKTFCHGSVRVHGGVCRRTDKYADERNTFRRISTQLLGHEPLKIKSIFFVFLSCPPFLPPRVKGQTTGIVNNTR